MTFWRCFVIFTTENIKNSPRKQNAGARVIIRLKHYAATFIETCVACFHRTKKTIRAITYGLILSIGASSAGSLSHDTCFYCPCRLEASQGESGKG